MSQYLSHPEIHQQEFEPLVYFGPDRWFVMRMILTPTVGLVAVGPSQRLFNRRQPC